jgi:transposase-like protein
MHTKVRGDLLEGHAGITATSYANDVVAELTGIWLGHVDILSGRPPRQARSVVTDSRGSPFLGGLVDRGLAGVRLVISDAHASLIKAIRPCFQGASWQRCRVHARRNLLAAPNHRHCQVIAALIRTIFVQPDTNTATAQLRAVVDQLLPYAPGVADRLEKMETDLLAHTGFPTAQWSKIWSNNPLERLNRELKRRTDVVGIFPFKASGIHLSAPCSSRPTTK